MMGRIRLWVGVVLASIVVGLLGAGYLHLELQRVQHVRDCREETQRVLAAARSALPAAVRELYELDEPARLRGLEQTVYDMLWPLNVTVTDAEGRTVLTKRVRDRRGPPMPNEWPPIEVRDESGALLVHVAVAEPEPWTWRSGVRSLGGDLRAWLTGGLPNTLQMSMVWVFLSTALAVAVVFGWLLTFVLGWVGQRVRVRRMEARISELDGKLARSEAECGRLAKEAAARAAVRDALRGEWRASDERRRAAEDALSEAQAEVQRLAGGVKASERRNADGMEALRQRLCHAEAEQDQRLAEAEFLDAECTRLQGENDTAVGLAEEVEAKLCEAQEACQRVTQDRDRLIAEEQDLRKRLSWLESKREPVDALAQKLLTAIQETANVKPEREVRLHGEMGQDVDELVRGRIREMYKAVAWVAVEVADLCRPTSSRRRDEKLRGLEPLQCWHSKKGTGPRIFYTVEDGEVRVVGVASGGDWHNHQEEYLAKFRRRIERFEPLK